MMRLRRRIVHAIFIGHIIIGPHHAMLTNRMPMLQKPVEFLAAQSVVQKIFVHQSTGVVAIAEVQGKKSFLIEKVGMPLGGGRAGVKILARFALDKQRIGPDFEDLLLG